MKQMRILHSNGFNDDELYQQRSVVYSNTVQAMGALLKAMQEYKLSFRDSERSVGSSEIVFLKKTKNGGFIKKIDFFGKILKNWKSEINCKNLIFWKKSKKFKAPKNEFFGRITILLIYFPFSKTLESSTTSSKPRKNRSPSVRNLLVP